MRKEHLVVQAVWGVALLTYLFASLLLPTPVRGSNALASSPLRSSQVGDDLYVEWHTAGTDAATAADALAALPVLRFQGYELPMHLVTLRLTQPVQSTTLQILHLTSVAWADSLQPAPPLQPPAPDWEVPGDLLPPEKVALPESPIFFLRHGQIAGQPFAVLAISPFYQANGAIKLVTHVAATVLGATVIQDNLAAFLQASPQPATGAATGSAASQALAPSNGAAALDAVKLIVSQPGIQRIDGQSLAAAKLDVTKVDLTTLHLYWHGREIPLEIIQSPTVELRFYAPPVGDRWNAHETYWLTVEPNQQGLRMATRAVTPGSAPPSQQATAKGVWEQNQLYQSNQAGPDGDHWFHQALETNPSLLGNPAAYPTATLILSDSLPRASGTSSITFTLSTYYKAHYTVTIGLSGTAQQLAWDSAPNGVLIQDWALPVTTTAPLEQIQLTLLPGPTTAGLYLDRVFWHRPVTLDFQHRGAPFTGRPDYWFYQWRNVPLDQGQIRLYDVTDPLAPVILTGATPVGFQDGPGIHDYLLAGPGVEQTVDALAHKGDKNFGLPTGGNALYIAPAEFMPALEPLRAHRNAQGYSVQLVDVQAIYDAWSYGQVSPEAIRTFLRYARATWQPAPLSVVLVGDATWDPHNYLGKNNTNFMPPYLANVDPWLGETACENCYAQLDGDDPLTGDGQLFKTDLWIGRFPVKTAAELTAVVAKLIDYETDQRADAWRSKTLLVAGNYIKALDANGAPIVEGAGNFAQLSDDLLALTPAQTQIKRVYYDPYPAISDPQGVESWRIADPNEARSLVLTELSNGAGLVVYNGHSNHWQWLMTHPSAVPNYLLTLYDPDQFWNYNSLYIQLSMTCFTAQFPMPAFSGTTVDERAFLNPQGGAVAIWGSAGMSLTRGHAALQDGFFRALWAAEPMQARLGELLDAGYTELLTEITCCQDVLQTFLLLGDPLTPARVHTLDYIAPTPPPTVTPVVTPTPTVTPIPSTLPENVYLPLVQQ